MRSTAPTYDSIGRSYARTRREDPGLRARIRAALGDAHTVVNVGAGAGSYEPNDRHVIAIEPSETMIAQRARTRVPAVRGTADALPLLDDSVDATMAVLTIHHWGETQQQGIMELCRVARKRVVIVTFDPEVSGEMWLARDYLPEVAELDRRTFPSLETLAERLDGSVTISTLPISRDTPDWTFGSFWAHPERVLNSEARDATSGFALMPCDVVNRAVHAVAWDLRNGAWDRRYGDLRGLDRFDAGMRLVVADLRSRRPAGPC